MTKNTKNSVFVVPSFYLCITQECAADGRHENRSRLRACMGATIAREKSSIQTSEGTRIKSRNSQVNML